MSDNMMGLAQQQQMTEMATAQFYQQYMQQYQALVAQYDARIHEGDSPGSASSAAGAQSAPNPVNLLAGALQQPAQPPTAEEMRADLLRLDQAVKEAEAKAKRAATLSNHYVGIIDRFDTRKGHGFVSCPETYVKYKQDIFIDRESFQGAKVGDTCVFSLGFNKKGAVRACDVRKLNEVSRLKEELEQRRNALFATLPAMAPIAGTGKGGGKKGKAGGQASGQLPWGSGATGMQNPLAQKRPHYEESSSLIKRQRW